jgi:hypothetical protein
MFNEICRIVGLIVITNYAVDYTTKAIEKYAASKREKEVADAQ